MTVRLSREEREGIKAWLNHRPDGWRRFYDIEQVAYSPGLTVSESVQPNGAIYGRRLVFEAVEMTFGARWRQWVAVDVESGEPVAFGKIEEVPAYARVAGGVGDTNQ